MKERLRRRGGGVGRRGRRRRRRAGAARPRRAAARDRPAPDRGRLLPLGGEGDARPLLADPLRAPPGRRRRRVPRRALRRRHDDDQHEGRAARARARRRQVAPGDRPDERQRASRSASPTSPRTTTGSSRLLGVRERSDWQKCVHTVDRGFRALGSRARAGHLVHRRQLHALRLLPAGLPDQRRQVDDEHVHRGHLGARAARAARGARTSSASWSRTGGRPASSTSTARASGTTVRAGAVVVAGGALNTPQILRRSGLDAPAIGRHLGLHPVRLVYGLLRRAPGRAHDLSDLVALAWASSTTRTAAS